MVKKRYFSIHSTLFMFIFVGFSSPTCPHEALPRTLDSPHLRPSTQGNDNISKCFSRTKSIYHAYFFKVTFKPPCWSLIGWFIWSPAYHWWNRQSNVQCNHYISLKIENSRIIQDLYDPSVASNQFRVQFLKSQPIFRKYGMNFF